MNDLFYFAYGSNMNPERMTARGAEFDSYEHGLLQHYRLRSNKISKKYKTMAFVNIEPCFEDQVFGVLYKLAHHVDLAELDRKEGYPTHYEKTFVPVHTKDGVKIALVYIATRTWSNDNDLPMPAEYKELMNEGLEKCEDLMVHDGELYEQFLQYRERTEGMTRL